MNVIRILIFNLLRGVGLVLQKGDNHTFGEINVCNKERLINIRKVSSVNVIVIFLYFSQNSVR